MFGKLFKYDFKSNYKWYCITFAILLSLSILMGFITGSSLRPEVMERYSDYPMATSGVIFTLYLLFLLLFLHPALSFCPIPSLSSVGFIKMFLGEKAT